MQKMDLDEKPEINPFVPSIPMHPLTKPRARPNFQFGRNDHSELSFKIKTIPKNYHQLKFNPFEGLGKVPFRRDEDIPPVKKGLINDRNISKNKRSSDDKTNIRPNINIFFISDSSFLNNNPFQNINIKCKKEKEQKNIVDNDAPAPVPDIAPNDPVSDLNDNFSKMKLRNNSINPFEIKLGIEKKNEERIHISNLSHLGDCYID